MCRYLQPHLSRSYDTTRPISCYEGSVTQEITGDVALEEKLVTCSLVQVGSRYC